MLRRNCTTGLHILAVNEHHLYGSARLGMDVLGNLLTSDTLRIGFYFPDECSTDFNVTPLWFNYTDNTETEEVRTFSGIRGARRFELTNHLGNVSTVISDRRTAVFTTGSSGQPVLSYYLAEVVSSTEYWPFGSAQQTYTNTLYAQSKYRFGYQGIEQDNDGAGYDYFTEFRLYSAQLGRWLSTDLIEHLWESPYAGMGNSPVTLNDPLGLSSSPSPNKPPTAPIDSRDLSLPPPLSGAPAGGGGTTTTGGGMNGKETAGGDPPTGKVMGPTKPDLSRRSYSYEAFINTPIWTFRGGPVTAPAPSPLPPAVTPAPPSSSPPRVVPPAIGAHVIMLAPMFLLTGDSGPRSQLSLDEECEFRRLLVRINHLTPAEKQRLKQLAEAKGIYGDRILGEHAINYLQGLLGLAAEFRNTGFSADQNKHYAPWLQTRADDRSMLSMDPNLLWQDLLSGRGVIVDRSIFLREGRVLVQFQHNIGNFVDFGLFGQLVFSTTGFYPSSKTRYAYLHFGKKGIHFVPANPIQN
jgi:RHS repeat-associated protein